MKGAMGQQISYMSINWGAFDHASRAPQLRSCTMYVHVYHSYSLFLHTVYIHNIATPVDRGRHVGYVHVITIQIDFYTCRDR